jgi:chemotaxis protein MotB
MISCVLLKRLIDTSKSCNMKQLFILVPLLSLIASCGPVYKCGEQAPDRLAGGNRLLLVVEERDQLCKENALFEAENTLLKDTVVVMGNKITDLRSANSALANDLLESERAFKNLETDFQELTKEQIELQKKYSNLFTDSYTQAHLYNERLKVKEQELERKEKLVQEREAAIRELERQIARQDSIAKRMNDILRNALLGFNSDELTIEIKDGKVYVSMSDKLLFKSGSAAVEKKGQDAIAILADVIKKNQDFDVWIEGHTDNVPIRTNQYQDNWDLSVARATSIVRLLTASHSVPPQRLTASGKGEFSPRATNDTADGRAKNRRTDIILSPRLDELMKLLGQ